LISLSEPRERPYPGSVEDPLQELLALLDDLLLTEQEIPVDVATTFVLACTLQELEQIREILSRHL
jgi:hypothetical protein